MNVEKEQSLKATLFLAVVAQVICGFYLQLIEWVPLFPWNDIRRGNGQAGMDVVLLFGQLLIVFIFVKRWLSGIILGVALYSVWFYLQVDSWWIPYLRGGKSVGPSWYFVETYKFLPQIGQRPTPDAAHVVLQAMLLAVLVSGVLAAIKIARFRKRQVA